MDEIFARKILHSSSNLLTESQEGMGCIPWYHFSRAASINLIIIVCTVQQVLYLRRLHFCQIPS